MKLILLALLPIVYSARLIFDATGNSAGIQSYAFSYTNPGGVGTSGTGTYETDMGTKINDNDLATGVTLSNLGSSTGWGASGVQGTFIADKLVPGTGNMFFKITDMSISFFSDGCVSNTPATIDVSAFRYAPGSTTREIITENPTITTTTVGSGTVFTISASVTNGNVNNDMGIGFDVTKLGKANGNCQEGQIAIREFVLTGEVVAETDPPTQAPTTTSAPTLSPTTRTPTMAPTRRCTGEITWGDPHFHLMAFDKSVDQFNYQGLGWYYYIFPCSMKNYQNWPFFLQSEHKRCWYKGNPKGCIGNNRLIINTKPDPWIFEFTNRNLNIAVGTDLAGQTAANFNTNTQYTKRNPLVIEYDDGNAGPSTTQQKGEIKIYYEKGDIVFELNNVQYNAYPRTCGKGEGQNQECGDYMCENQVIEIRNSGSWSVYSCPTCLRNLACGIMGKYYKGDCNNREINDPNNGCHYVLLGSDGNTYTPPNNDGTFRQFADTWHEDSVNAAIVSNNLNVLYLQERNALHLSDRQNMAPLREGRAANGPDLAVVDTNYYDGLCRGNMAEIQRINATCRQNTVVKYAKCCKEIGICPILWKACIEDLCSCSAPNGNSTWTEALCLDSIIHDSMNTTCSWDRLYPTATPTATPTKSPTGLVAGLKPGQKAMKLIWLYLIFVVVFVLIAGAAYWYYRKKNKGGAASFPQDEEQAEKRDMEMGAADTTTYA